MKQNHTTMSRSRKTRSSSKSNAATLFNRYVWLVDTIYRAGRITFEEINERWQRSSLNETGEELPLKTFHNHKNAIQQMFDINIECNRKGGYLYYIEHAEDMERGGVRTWLLNTFAVNHLINESHHLKRRILFEEIPSGQRFLTQIIEAMRDNRTLEMSYQSFGTKRPIRSRWRLIASRCSASGGMSWHAARAMTGCASMRWTASGSSAPRSICSSCPKILTRRPTLSIR